MYEAFFGLTGRPFQLNPDPSFYYGSRGHSSAFSYLQYGAFQGEGFIVVTGEIGSGKTTLVRALLEKLDPTKIVAAQLVSTLLESSDLLRAVANAFGVVVRGATKAEILASLEAFLISQLLENRRPLLFVDEAQNLSVNALEELRMLSNFQYGDRALLQSFLVGQPELRDKLRDPAMEQLRQRVIASYHLGTMDVADTRAYIEHRLAHVGWKQDPNFSDAAYHAIYEVTAGLPRKINTLTNRLLLSAFLANKHEVDAADVDIVAQELRDEIGGMTLSPLPAAEVMNHRPAHPSTDASPSSAPVSTSAVKESPTIIAKPEHQGALLCIVGARPNFMKMAPLLRALRARKDLPPAVLVHTGQHYDFSMSDQLFTDLGLPRPDVNLEVGSGSHAVQTAEIMKRFEPVVDAYVPSAVIVVGDVNSTIACALVASKKNIPVIHVEAGLRSHDRSMPEEINRVLTDQISDLLYTTERSAHAHLAREGIDAANIEFVGNLMIDSLLHALPQAVSAQESVKKAGLPFEWVQHPKGYGVVTMHRPSNVDDAETYKEILESLSEVSKQLPLLWPMHPRAKANLQKFGLEKIIEKSRIGILPPLGYLEMVGLTSKATVIITDSGGVQEESTALGVPCLTMRANTERPITIEQGTNILIGINRKRLLYEVAEILKSGGRRGRVPEYWDGKTAERIAWHLVGWLAKRRGQDRQVEAA